jgi:hypothetical protein
LPAYQPPSEVLLEIERRGGAQFVRAVDSESLVEVAFQAPLAASRGDIERLALAKLAYVTDRQQQAEGKTKPAGVAPAGRVSPITDSRHRRGWVV